METFEELQRAAFLAGSRAGQSALWDTLGAALFRGVVPDNLLEQLCETPCGDTTPAHIECWVVIALLSVHQADRTRVAEAWAAAHPSIADALAAAVAEGI